MQKVRLQQRARMTLEVLREGGAETTPMSGGEVWRQVAVRLPLEGDELDPQTAGPAGQVRWRWSTVDLAHAGWLLKDPSGSGAWTLPAAGRAALDQHVDPAEFDAELTRAAQAALQQQKLTRQQRLAAEVLPNDIKQERVIRAAQVFVDSAFKLGESAFVPGRPIWSSINLRVLRGILAQDAPEKSAAAFETWLASALNGAPDEVKLLAAELLALQFLPINGGIGEITKQSRVVRILESLQRPVEIPAIIRQAFSGGAFGVGFPMVQNLARAVRYVAEVMESWTECDVEQQALLLDDPLAFRDFMAGAAEASFPSQRNAMQYLVHPEYFGPIVSDLHKQQIRDAFGGEVLELTEDLESDLHAITLALQVKEESAVDFYREPLRKRWPKVDAAPTPRPEDDDVPDPVPNPTQTLGELAAELHLDPDWLKETVAMLHERRQVIFSGPPGTGKTYLATRLARLLAPQEGAVELIQFHPSYSYEDFFEGYRPGPDGAGFVLRAGPFRRLSDRARRNEDRTYVLVIDEINRGNLSKIFGELYFLLEYRNERITLLYGDEEADNAGFTLPENVLILGTMNTADRSIALLDAAMRRRFAFVELHPDRTPIRQMFASWAQAEPGGSDLVQLLEHLNARIEDDAWKIGPSYLMRGNLTEGRLQTIWRYDILPLLAELHYGDGVDVEARYGLEALRSSAPPAEPHA